MSALGDTTAERLVKKFLGHYAARDLESLLELTAEGFVWTDHRSLGWEPLRGREGMASVLESGWEGTLDLRIEVDEVVARDERVVAVRFRWVGHNARGGLFELPAGQVIATDAERYRSVDQYGYDDRDAILARFAELDGNGKSVLGDRPPERFYAEYGRRWAAGDVDGLLAMAGEEWVQHDHRNMPLWETGRADLATWLEGALGPISNPQHDVLEVLACDEDVIAFHCRYSGIARRGIAWEIEAGVVAVIRDGLAVSEDDYEPTDRQAMIARYVELGGGLSALGDSPPERACAEHSRLLARRDLDAIVAQFREDYVMRDHRTTVSVDVPRADVRASFEAMFSATETIRLETDEVLACNDRVIARRLAHRATGAVGGGAAEVRAAWVTVVEDGLLVSTDVYDYDADAAVLARFAELTAQSERPDPRSSTRWLLQFIDAYNRHDPAGVVSLVTDGFVLVDHRTNGWGTIEGPEGLRENHVASFQMSPDISMAIDSVVAGDRRVGAVCFTYRGHMADGGGEFEYVTGYVTLVEDGLALSTDVYDPDDRQGMIARYVELGGGLSALGDRPPERILAEWCRLYARRDLEPMMALLAKDFIWIDHRPLSWEPIDREGMRRVTLSGWAEAADIRIEIDEVLAVDDRAIAVRNRFVGTGAQAGAFELAIGQVARYENGVCVSLDQYGHDDTDVMLARFAELSASAPVDAGQSAG